MANESDQMNLLSGTVQSSQPDFFSGRAKCHQAAAKGCRFSEPLRATCSCFMVSLQQEGHLIGF